MKVISTSEPTALPARHPENLDVHYVLDFLFLHFYLYPGLIYTEPFNKKVLHFFYKIKKAPSADEHKKKKANTKYLLKRLLKINHFCSEESLISNTRFITLNYWMLQLY